MARSRSRSDWLTPPVSNPTVHTFRLPLSRSYLVVGTHPVLIDAGTPADTDRLIRRITAVGVKVQDLAAIILTHAHSDHAGSARAISEASGAPIVAGAGDIHMLRNGRHDDTPATSLFAKLFSRLAVNPAYPPCESVVPITSAQDLNPYGLDALAVPVPGHSPGSIAVVTRQGIAFAGDMVLGGWLGGALFPNVPGRQYFHADESANLESLDRLLALDVRTMYLGHGGPVSADDVRDWRARSRKRQGK